MRTKDIENELKQRELLLNSAWKLFREKGYQNTTMMDIVREANVSKGRFYYYFQSKGELLDYMYKLFDQKYEEYFNIIPSDLSPIDKLIELSRMLFEYLETNIGSELIISLYKSQLDETTGVNFWDTERALYRIVGAYIAEGQETGTIRSDVSAMELVEDVIAEERSLIMNWCLQKGAFPLAEVSMPKLQRFYEGFR